MTENEAREIVAKYAEQLKGKIPPIDDFVPTIENFRAMGYLAALDKAKGLEEAAKDIVETSLLTTMGMTPRLIQNIAALQRSLSEWRKVK